MIPLILWRSKVPTFLSLTAFFAIEVAFNVYPAKAWSSLILQVAHILLLVAIFSSTPKYEESEIEADENEESKKKA